LTDLPTLAGRAARRLRRNLEHWLLGYRGYTSIALARAHAGGYLDAIEVGQDGILNVVGWSPDSAAFSSGLRLAARDGEIAPAHVFRIPRPDLSKLTGLYPERLGLIAEFVLPQTWSNERATLRVGGENAVSVRVPPFEPPAYSQFYGNPGVWHREHVYNVGPPMPHVSPDVLGLCADLEAPLLDFGCGAGALVAALRARGLDAFGLEVDEPIKREYLMDGLLSFVTYYDGRLPAPYEDGAFASVTCCEVLEHIPDYEAAVAEMRRLTRDRLLVTVPDMSAVPRSYRHGVVPWHLMEASHVNFFTQQSLGDVLGRHFRDVEFFRVGELRCDRLRFYSSIVARCRR
jgi:2-polyprenyl-3-methyl-5-hydroxy-6-metoxy-1,4-benzoquinol methylase